jgi:hypothetical protein
VLRLLVRGHDIKSIAGELGISLTAANERLRTARQKLGVSSSREAARILAAEEGGPNFAVDRQIVVAPKRVGGASRGVLFVWTGVVMAAGISMAIALMAIFGAHQPGGWAPKAVRTIPSSGAVVPPGPLTLAISFDQPMVDGSFSYVQKAVETFPECAFPAHLSYDKRTFTVRCTVQPGRDYEIWFNSPPYMNFKSATGVAAEPHQLLFRTRGR